MQLHDESIQRLWHMGTDAGLGFAVGGNNDDVNTLADMLDGDLLQAAGSSTKAALYGLPGGRLLAVGEAYGPWAVDIKELVKHLLRMHGKEALPKSLLEHPVFDQAADA